MATNVGITYRRIAVALRSPWAYVVAWDRMAVAAPMTWRDDGDKVLWKHIPRV